MASDRKLQAIIMAKDEASKVFKKVQGSLESMGKKFRAVQDVADDFGKKMLIVGGAGVLAIKGFIDAAAEAERTQSQLNSVLKSTGGIAGVTADMALNLSSSLQKVTTIGDEAILSAENMLLTYTNIGKDAFPSATEAVLDMATAMSNGVTPSTEQLSSTAVQLGKALNDPIKNMSALTRNGVQFTEQQQKQITSLQKSGDLMGAQKIILGELAKEFGGSAKSQLENFDGEMKNVMNRLGDIQEVMGEKLKPVIQYFTQQITKLVDWFEALTPQQQEFIAQSIAIGTSLAIVTGALGVFIAAMNPVTIAISGIAIGFGLLTKDMLSNGTSWQELALTIKKAWNDIAVFVSEKIERLIQLETMLPLVGKDYIQYLEKQKEITRELKMQSISDEEEILRVKKKRIDDEKTFLEDQIAQQRDIVNKAAGEEKKIQSEKLEDLKKNALSKFKDINLGSTAELAKMREAHKAELEKINNAFKEKLGEQVKSAFSWGEDFIKNMNNGISGKLTALNMTIELVKGIMNKVHQSYNPDIPVQEWGEHFIQNFVTGLKNQMPKVFSQTNEMTKILTEKFADDGEMLKAIKEWKADKVLGEKFQEIADQIQQNAQKIKDQMLTLKGDYESLNQSAGESLKQLKDKHTETIKDITGKIDELKAKLQELQSGYQINISGLNSSIGEEIVKQQDLVADLKKQLAEAISSSSGSGNASDIEQRLAKEQEALQAFLKDNTQYEEQIAEARRRTNLTDFERFLEDINARRDALAKEFEEKQKMLNDEIAALEVQKLQEAQIYEQKIAEYEKVKSAFALFQTRLQNGLGDLANTTQAKVDFMNKKLAELRATIASINDLVKSPLVTGATPGNVPGFASGGVVNGPTLATIGEGGVPEAVVPLPDGRSIPVQFNGGSAKGAVTITQSFGDITISSDVDAEKFLNDMKASLIRDIQLQELGSF